MDQAGVDREALAADKARRDTGFCAAFEDLTEDITAAEAFVARSREGRMIGQPCLRCSAPQNHG